MKTCKLLVTTQTGQKLAGTITLSNGKVSSVPNIGYTVLVNNVMDTKGTKDPEQWFNSLEETYNGSYLRAMVEKVKNASDLGT